MKIEIRSLRIINCGPLRDVCIDFCGSSGKPEPIIVLAGANGSGKTTALELIAALSELFDRESNIWRHNPGETILDRTEYAELNLLINETNISVHYSLATPDMASPEGTYVVFPLSPGRLGARAFSSNVHKILNNINQQIRFPERSSVEFNRLDQLSVNSLIPSVLYFPHNRSIMPLQGKQVQREETLYQWAHRFQTVQTFNDSLDSYLIWLDYAEPETFSHVIEFLDSLDFDGKKFGVLRKELKAVVTTKDGQIHDLASLSSGEQNILIMLFELRRRLIPGSIVLIDEIENSLHPAFQYQLALALKKMQESIPFQLIVTTHAPAFLDIFGEASVRILTEF